MAVYLAAMGPYCNSLSGPFVFDDWKCIVTNSAAHRLTTPSTLLADSKLGATRPVALFSIQINYALGGLNSRGYHVFNLGVHLAAGLVLMSLVEQTLVLPRFRGRHDTSAPWIAASAAALWLAHPLSTQSVTYIVQRCESMMALCYLLCLYCVLQSTRSERPWGWNAAAIAACWIGMGTKEVMVTAPLVALVYDRIFLAPSWIDVVRKRAGLHIGLASSWLLVGLLLFWARRQPPESVDFGLANCTPWEYARTQPSVICHYLRLVIWPHPLCLDYAWPVADTFWEIVPPSVLLLVLLSATCAALWYAAPLGFLGVAFFLILAPTSSFMPIRDLAFEHRMYLPSASLVVLGVVGGHELLRAMACRRGLGAGAAARWLSIMAAMVVVVLGVLTYQRNHDYADPRRLWESVVGQRPDNPRGHLNLGIVYLVRNQVNDAAERFSRAAELAPNYEEAHTNLGLALIRLGRYDEAIDELRQSERLAPHATSSYLNLALAYEARGDWETAVSQYRQALGRSPRSATIHARLGSVLLRLGRVDEATDAFQRALKINPQHAAALDGLRRARVLSSP